MKYVIATQKGTEPGTNRLVQPGAKMKVTDEQFSKNWMREVAPPKKEPEPKK